MENGIDVLLGFREAESSTIVSMVQIPMIGDRIAIEIKMFPKDWLQDSEGNPLVKARRASGGHVASNFIVEGVIYMIFKEGPGVSVILRHDDEWAQEYGSE